MDLQTAPFPVLAPLESLPIAAILVLLPLPHGHGRFVRPFLDTALPLRYGHIPIFDRNLGGFPALQPEAEVFQVIEGEQNREPVGVARMDRQMSGSCDGISKDELRCSRASLSPKLLYFPKFFVGS